MTGHDSVLRRRLNVMLRALKTVTFLYVPQEDRIAGAINAGHPDAWSCWLTRRLALAVLERATGYIARSQTGAPLANCAVLRVRPK
jgi:hypothetical protein